MDAARRLERAVWPAYGAILRDLRKGKYGRRDQFSLPFMPQAGPQYDAAPHKVFVVGKVASVTQAGNARSHGLEDAYRAGDDHRLLEGLAGYWRANLHTLVADAFDGRVADGYEPHQLRTSWWAGIHRLIGPIVEARTPKDTFARIAWSNVLKVGGPLGNPTPAQIREQRPHIRMLLEEVRALEPAIVVFATGRRFDPHLRHARSDLTVDSNDVLARVTSDALPIAYRSRHFQGFAHERIDAFRQTLQDAIRAG